MMNYSRPTPVIISKAKELRDINDPCWKQQELKVSQVQKISKGKSAVLCFLDDGIGNNTELLNLKIDRWSYFAESQWNGSHSTFGATVIAGKTLGIFPEMSLVSKQVLEPASGLGGSAQIVAAIYKAKEMGIQTINLSLGSNYPDTKIEKALRDYCSNGINIATIAAGNDGPESNTSDFPANYAKNIKGVLSVAATQIDDDGKVTVALFSSRGTVSLGSPGHLLKSMDEESRLDFISGTSFSAPIAGATIAVARTLLNRPLYQDEVLSLFKKTSKQIAKYDAIGVGHIDIVEFLEGVKKLGERKIKKKSFFEKVKDLICN